MAALGNLPEDLMIEIVSMLPAESLLRFKSVCKFWYALINDPKFIRKHFCNSPPHDHVLLLRRVTLKCPKPQYTEEIENIFSIFSFNRFESFFDVHLPLDEDFMNFEICGHSHGLLCLWDMCSILLCNPTTREFRELPPSILLLTEDPDGYDLEPNAVGFGYDPKSKDFKVVRVVDFYGPRYIHCSRVEIYDLSKDRWREIESPVCGDFPSWAPYFQTYSEGTYYWWADVYQSTEMILTFDMSEEIFGRISIPEEVKEQPNKARNLGVLNGSIILINYNENTLDVWEINKDESEVFSWSRLLTINDPVFKIEEPLLFVSSDELLIEVKEGLVILYNIKTQHFKQLSIKGDPLNFEATFFVKSLLSVKGGMNGFLY